MAESKGTFRDRCCMVVMKHSSNGRGARRGIKACGFTLIELLVVVAIIGVLAAILSPVIAKSRNKANRSRDLGNLKNQVNAFTMFSNDQKGRYPWLTTKGGGNAVMRYVQPGAPASSPNAAPAYNWDSCLDIRRLHQARAIRETLKSARLLLSPCDPGGINKNQEACSAEKNFFGWTKKHPNPNSLEAKKNHGWMSKEVDEATQSYSICFGADVQKGHWGIMLLTRNHGGKWKTGYKYKYPGGELPDGGRRARRGSMVSIEKIEGWLDPKKLPPDRLRDAVMGLRANEGQMAFCDGSAKMVNDQELQQALAMHGKSTEGVLKIPNYNVTRPRH